MMNESSHQVEADNSLVARMARGDQSALSALYDRYAGKLLAVAVRVLRNESEAEDVLHDVFLEAWRSAGQFDASRASVRTWLVVRLRSRCLDRLRALRVRRDAPDDLPPRPAPLMDAEQMHQLSDAGRVREALSALPEAQREVLVLLYLRGFSSREVAERVGCPIGTVKSRVRLAMKQLRSQLVPMEST